MSLRIPDDREMLWDDFQPGDIFRIAERHLVTAEEIKEFAAKYDPQAFHLDDDAADASFFKGLSASGWMTASIAMRMRVRAIRIPGGMVGAGVEEIRWTLPVRADDTLRAEEEIMTTRKLASRPGWGIVKSRTTVFNQWDEVVMRCVVNFLAPLRSLAVTP